MNDYLKDKVFCVTGGTGTLGQSLVVRLLKEDPQKVVVFSRDELKQAEMEYVLNDKRVRFILGDIRDGDTLGRACHGCDIIFHAAALKRIEKCEYNPFEAVKTNIIGAQNVIDAAISNGVKKVVGISTDKAVNPTSLYGNTKACADSLFLAADAYAAGRTLFSVIRFGNFIGSRGSVIPLWKQQCDNGEPITLTDKEMTRFFITADEAVNRIFEVLRIMRGSEIFCPKMPSVKMAELAEVISNNGIKIIGKRGGEKTHEDLIVPEHADRTYEIGNFYVTTKLYRGIGNRVPANFCYRSDTNWDWIDSEAIV